MKYQDTRINGQTIEKGNRACAERYEIIKQFCGSIYSNPFTVLDIGANMCYFGLRLVEDFGCNVVAFEFHQFEKRNEIVKQNKTDKLFFLKRKLQLSDLKLMKTCCQFDVILALSVMHHLPGKTSDWIQEFRELGDNILIEFALDDSKRTANKKDYKIPDDATILGHGESHLNKEIKRPIFHIKGN